MNTLRCMHIPCPGVYTLLLLLLLPLLCCWWPRVPFLKMRKSPYLFFFSWIRVLNHAKLFKYFFFIPFLFPFLYDIEPTDGMGAPIWQRRRCLAFLLWEWKEGRRGIWWCVVRVDRRVQPLCVSVIWSSRGFITDPDGRGWATHCLVVVFFYMCMS